MLTTYGGKEKATKAKEKEKAATKEAGAKASTGVKDATKDSTKAAKETTGYNKSKGKGYSGSKGYGSSKGYKGQGNCSKSKGKGSNNYATCHRCGKPGHWAQDCRVPVWHIGEGEDLHPLEQEQADHDNNDELPQDVNDTWDWYYEGEEGQHEVNYTEENWNDYDYDNSSDWNDNSYEDTANYIGGINESHLIIGHIRQAKSRGTTTARAFNNSYKKTPQSYTST